MKCLAHLARAGARSYERGWFWFGVGEGVFGVATHFTEPPGVKDHRCERCGVMTDDHSGCCSKKKTKWMKPLKWPKKQINDTSRMEESLKQMMRNDEADTCARFFNISKISSSHKVKHK